MLKGHLPAQTIEADVMDRQCWLSLALSLSHTHTHYLSLTHSLSHSLSLSLSHTPYLSVSHCLSLSQAIEADVMERQCWLVPLTLERNFFNVNLLVRIHFIIVMIRWTGLAPWEFEFPFPGSLTSKPWAQTIEADVMDRQCWLMRVPNELAAQWEKVSVIDPTP